MGRGGGGQDAAESLTGLEAQMAKEREEAAYTLDAERASMNAERAMLEADKVPGLASLSHASPSPSRTASQLHLACLPFSQRIIHHLTTRPPPPLAVRRG